VHEQIRYFCSPHHQSSPLHTVINHLERNAGFANDDLPDQRLDKLAAMLGSVGLGDDDISLIAEFMSLPRGTRYPPLDLSPKRKKERILAALFPQFEGLARRPLRLVRASTSAFVFLTRSAQYMSTQRGCVPDRPGK
jgi:predicted ATPase